MPFMVSGTARKEQYSVHAQEKSQRLCPQAGPARMENGRPVGAKRGKFAVSIASVAAACLSGAVLATPAHAATAMEGASGLQVASAAAPYSEEEIQSLQQSGDFAGASSRITANQYAMGHMYQNN
jgi:hypothetical protein